jgi:hypothetical protein
MVNKAMLQGMVMVQVVEMQEAMRRVRMRPIPHMSKPQRKIKFLRSQLKVYWMGHPLKRRRRYPR